MASKNTARYIVIHCTDYSYRKMFDQFVACNGWHKDRDFPISSKGLYIGYHRLITGDLNYQTRADDEEGAHCNQRVNGVSMNFQSLGVCVGFDGDIEQMTPKQYELLQKQVWEWQDKYNITNDRVKLHRDYATDKTCPGKLITDEWLKNFLQRPLPIPPDVKLNACIAEKEDLKVQLKWYEQIINKIFK